MTGSPSSLGVLGLALAVGSAVACVRIGAFTCERDTQCARGDMPGMCVAPGHCAEPDGGCDSGFRYVEGAAPGDLAGTCVPVPDSGTTTGVVIGTSSGDGTTTGEGTDTLAVGDTTTGSTGVVTDCGDRPCACTQLAAAGQGHTCALRTDGSVTCWGDNAWGDLGLGDQTDPIPWPQEPLVPEGLVIESLHSGNHHLCAIAPDGEAWCWGRNNDGETKPELKESVAPPVVVETPEPLGAIALAPQHTCSASARSGIVRCHGDNTSGELGSEGEEPGPFETTVPGGAPVDELALGRHHSCARRGARVWCWGADGLGQLGVQPGSAASAMPVEVSLPADAIKIFGGRNHTCAVMDDGVIVLCWGAGTNGQIGDGMAINALVPTPMLEPFPAAVVSASGRLDTSCALLADGDIWCWGGTSGEEIGADIEPKTPMTVPLRIGVVDELPEPIADLTTGLSHLCAWSASGRLWCWGADDEEQLGPIDPPAGMHAVEIDVECPPGIGS